MEIVYVGGLSCRADRKNQWSLGGCYNFSISSVDKTILDFKPCNSGKEFNGENFFSMYPVAVAAEEAEFASLDNSFMDGLEARWCSSQALGYRVLVCPQGV